jgi:hypothetical protein
MHWNGLVSEVVDVGASMEVAICMGLGTLVCVLERSWRLGTGCPSFPHSQRLVPTQLIWQESHDISASHSTEISEKVTLEVTTMLPFAWT